MIDGLRWVWFTSYPFGLYAGVFLAANCALIAAARLQGAGSSALIGWWLLARYLPLGVVRGLVRLRIWIPILRGRSYEPRDLAPWMVDLCEARLGAVRSGESTRGSEVALLRTLVALYAPLPPWSIVRLRVAHCMLGRAAWFAACLTAIDGDHGAFSDLLRRSGNSDDVANGLGPVGALASDVVDLAHRDPTRRANARARLLGAQTLRGLDWPSMGQYLAPWCENRLAEHDWHAVEVIVSHALEKSTWEDLEMLASLLARTYRGLEARARDLAPAADNGNDPLRTYYGTCALRYEALAAASPGRPRCSHPAALEGAT